MRENKLKLGVWVTIADPTIIEVLSQTGLDWICIDIEHTAISINQLKTLVATIQANSLEAFVRIGSHDKVEIKRVLDIGPDGIIVPNVRNNLELLAIIDAAYYPPLGSRGVGLYRAQNYGINDGFEKYREAHPKNLKLVIQVEHFEAIDNLAEMISNKQVYATLIGPFDLSGSLGLPGKFNDKSVQNCLEKYEHIVRDSSVKLGYHIIRPNKSNISEKVSKGYDFIALGLDTLLLAESLKQVLKDY